MEKVVWEDGDTFYFDDGYGVVVKASKAICMIIKAKGRYRNYNDIRHVNYIPKGAQRVSAIDFRDSVAPGEIKLAIKSIKATLQALES